MTFHDLHFEPFATVQGHQARVSFPNGYRASVIRGRLSYGGLQGLYELAVLDDTGVCYSTPITDDVCGYLTPDEVTDLLQRIEALPPTKAQKAVRA